MAYRIVQEAFTNTLNHAGPHTRIDVSVAAEGPESRIRVRDDGRADGATRPRQPAEQGHGLAGMRERAALYGGTVDAGPARGGGWVAHAVLDIASPDGAP